MTPGSSDPKNGIVLYNFDLDGKFETGDKIKVTLKAGTAKSQLYSNSVYQISGVTEADIEVLSQNNAITPDKGCSYGYTELLRYARDGGEYHDLYGRCMAACSRNPQQRYGFFGRNGFRRELQ